MENKNKKSNSITKYVKYIPAQEIYYNAIFWDGKPDTFDLIKSAIKSNDTEKISIQLDGNLIRYEYEDFIHTLVQGIYPGIFIVIKGGAYLNTYTPDKFNSDFLKEFKPID